VVKKSLFDRVGGFASEFVNGEDADFVMKCGTEPGFVQVVCPFTFGYRKHEANITKAFDKNLAGARLQIRNEKRRRPSIDQLHIRKNENHCSVYR
jgi:hypothetical protein